MTAANSEQARMSGNTVEHKTCGGHIGETFPDSYACEVRRGLTRMEDVPAIFRKATEAILGEPHTNYNTGELCYCNGDS